ncbi:Vegetative incompatibility protein HET-E-1 [Psilocybe cubensis]|uniref:Vegetative incompatibility protein HET-E-1 n=2 Tax=Psilocybe cubensis TaxID=181762 RepID=A0ACB8GW52_PSICU|nr:Vegetative incompatibility protein HET-E-1 [Psilocybe cubensis]KAH9479858.1 Vegetative incompatibility protein HET-E-1 [Psilocybe cubensis]
MQATLTASRAEKPVYPAPLTMVTTYDPHSDKFVILRDFLLDALAFKAMNDREEQVTEAYSETFNWIYDHDDHEFAVWLSGASDESMFWIHGLPGSGKSTLMRYISQQSRTMELLRMWAGGEPITLANFFFWESGTAVQRSQAGLLRSLLYQLLGQQPDLIPAVFPILWDKIWKADTRTRIQLTSNWSLSDLLDAFYRFFEICDNNRHVCLLIDGLDEFEGDHQIMIDLLERARQRPRTKIGLSSRPWEVFRKAFSTIPALRLQDLTTNDMIQFVNGKLRANSRIRILMDAEPQAGTDLVNVVVSRANGVFLWVSLVVRTVIKNHGATVYHLASIQKLVESLPTSLDDLFSHFLLRHPSDSQPKMSRIFQLMRAREEVCDFTRDEDSNVLHLWEMALTAGYVSNVPSEALVHEMPKSQVYQMCIATLTDILENCAGLVEVHKTTAEKKIKPSQSNASSARFLPQRKISYLHRTVKDYLRKEDIWNEIVSHLPSIDPHLLHVRSVHLQFKHPIGAPRKQRNINAWWSRIVLAMTHARYCRPASHEAMFDYLNAFDDTLNWYCPPRGGSVAIDSWARSCFGTYEERASRKFPDPFLSLAVKFGVVGYVGTYLDTLEYEYEQEKPLLSHAVEYLVNRQSTVYPLSNPELVEVLLSNGEDPNLIKQPERDTIIQSLAHKNSQEHPSVDDEDYQPPQKPPPALKTPWVLALEAVQQAHRKGWIEPFDIRPEGTARWARILRALLEHGAHPNVMVSATYRDKEESAADLLTRVFEAYMSSEVNQVKDLFIERLKEASIGQC